MAASIRHKSIYQHLYIFGILATTLCIQVLADEEHYEALSSLTIEHTFDEGPDPVYIRRGVVTIHSITANNARIDQEDSHTPEDMEQLKNLAANNGMYRIRVQSKPATATSPAQYVHSFTTACGLYESALSDTLTIHLDSYGGLLGISLTTPTPHCLGISMNSQDLQDFNTTVELIQTITGPMPETQTYIQKMEQDKADKAKGQQAENKSFLAKYWMYIVPFVLIMMFANSMDPNAGQGGGGGGGGGGR